MGASEFVWVFHGAAGRFSSGVFSTRRKGEAWIKTHRLTGILTAYPVDVGVYDRAVERGDFEPKNERERSSEFIGAFTSASQEHYHYEDGAQP